jgi:HSP20 family protein
MSKRVRAGKSGVDAGLGGVLRGLGGFLDLVSKLTENGGGAVTRSGEIGGDGKGLRAVYGFTVRVGGAGAPVVEQFGNVRRDKHGPVVEEVREPMVDVFDEGEKILLVAELPGVEVGEVQVEIHGDVVSLSATHGERRYRKEVLLPSAAVSAGATSSCRNGVFELRLVKAK